MSRLIKTEEDIKIYIDECDFNILTDRIKDDRNNRTSRYTYGSAEFSLSNQISNWTLGEKTDMFDNHVIQLKEKTLRDLLQKYPSGIVINNVGGMCPLDLKSNLS